MYQVITGGWDRLATIWAADTGQCVQQLAGHDDQVRMQQYDGSPVTSL